MTTATTATALSFADERAIRDHYAVYTITARRDPDGWSFVSYQNTPLGAH